MNNEAATAHAGSAEAGPYRPLAAALAALIALVAIAWSLDLFRVVGLVLYTEQYLGGMLALGLALIYVHVPARHGRPRGGIPWHDGFAAAVGFAAGAYVAVRYPTLADDLFRVPADGVAAGGILIVLSLEGLRRVMGWWILAIVLLFIAHAAFGHLLPQAFAGPETGPERLIVYLALDANSLLGTPLIVATTVVIAFVLFGQVLLATGGSDFFTDVALALMGRYRGGTAKVSICASAAFGTISGSAVANVVADGVVTIPLMKKSGFAPHTAAAIEAVASTGGQLVPPVMGSAAFLMAEFLSIPYSAVALAAILPSVLYYGGLFCQVDLEAERLGIRGIARAQVPALLSTLARGWIFVAPFAILIYGLFWMNLRPEAAALYATAALVALGAVKGYGRDRLTPGALWRAVVGAGMGALEIIMICAGAGIIIGILNLSGLVFSLPLMLLKMGLESMALLSVVSAVICIVLGMGMPTVAVYVLLAPLIAPALVQAGALPLTAHLFVMYFGMMSMITPPVALAAFAAATLAKANPMRTGFTAMRLGWAAFVVPFLFLFAPALALQGAAGWFATLAMTVTSLGGVWLVSVAVSGYFQRPVSPLARFGFALAGLAVMVPADAFEGMLWTNIAGLALGLALLVVQLFAGPPLANRQPSAPEPGAVFGDLFCLAHQQPADRNCDRARVGHLPQALRLHDPRRIGANISFLFMSPRQCDPCAASQRSRAFGSSARLSWSYWRVAALVIENSPAMKRYGHPGTVPSLGMCDSRGS